MSEMPAVKCFAWIRIGSVNAIVSTIYAHRPGEIEVVYLDERDRAINEDAVWRDDGWHFLIPGVCGGYADNYSRLASFVSELRSGRKR